MNPNGGTELIFILFSVFLFSVSSVPLWFVL